MSKWFTANMLALNLDKTNVMKFVTYNSPQYSLRISYNKKKHIEDCVNTKFLHLRTNNHLNWRTHIIKQLPTSQAEKYIRWHQNIEHLTKKTPKPDESKGSI
jgi:hypothetical protein